MSAEKTFGVVLTAKTSQYDAAMAKSAAATAAMASTSARSFENVGKSMQKVGGKLTTMVSLPLVAAGAGALKLSSDFDTAFTRMVNLAGVTADQVDGLKKSVLALAEKTGVGPQELADGLYSASSAGLNTAQAMNAVTVAAEAAAVGMGKVDDIVGLVASATASYGAANITAAQATDVLTASVRDGRADPSELAGSMGKLLPIASALGISFPQVGGAVAYLSNVMGNTSTTVNGFQGVLNKLYAPSTQAKQALLDMGTSADQLKAAISANGLQGALELLRSKGFSTNSDAAHKLFDDVDALAAATALLQDKSGSLNSTMQDVATSQGALSTAFDNSSKTSSFKMKQAWADIQVALIKAGDIILPIIAKVSGAISSAASVFANLPTPVQDVVVGLLALAAVGGPLIAMAGTLLKNFSLIQGALKNMASSTSTLSTVAGSVGAALGVIAAGYATLQAVDAIAGRTGNTAKNVNAVVDASKHLGDGVQGTEQLVNAFGQLSQATMDAKPFENLAGDMAHWQTDADFNFRSMADAFNQVLSADPQAARQLVDQLQNVALAADAGDKGARQWMQGWGLTTEKIGEWDLATKNATSTGQDWSALTLDGADDILKSATATDASTASINANATATADAATKSTAYTDAVRSMAVDSSTTQRAIDRATDSLNKQVSSLEADLKAQTDLIDFSRGLADAQYALADSTDAYSKFLDDLPGQLKTIGKSKDSDAEKQREIAALYREGSSDAAKMADDTVAAFNEAAGGTLTASQKIDIWNTSALTAASTAKGPLRQSILDYISTTNDIPPNVETYIKALIDQGKLDQAELLLDQTSATRQAAIKAEADDASITVAKTRLDQITEFTRTGEIDVTTNTQLADAQMAAWVAKWRAALVMSPGTSSGGGFTRSAEGRFVPGGSNLLSTFGEKGPEAILPLDQQGRLRQLLSDPRIGAPILKALGMGGSQSAPSNTGGAGDFMRELFGSGGISTSSYGDFLSANNMSWQPTTAAAAAVADPTAAAPNDDDKMANEYAQGAIDAKTYDTYLAGREASEEKFSDAQQAIWSKREQVKRDQISATEAAEKEAADNAQAIADAQQKAADAKAAADQAAADREDARMQYLYDTQQISGQQYTDYLNGKLSGEQAYSAAWISLQGQIRKIRDDDAAKAKSDAQDQADADKATIDSAFEEMRLQQQLADAIRDEAAAYAELQTASVKAYLTGINGAATQGDRDSADADLDAAKAKEAAAVIAGADARANAQGLKDDTPEWAAFMRSEISNWLAGHQDLAPQLNSYLSMLPSFANGGYIPARAGGTLGWLAEAGQAEFAVPEPKMKALISSMGMSTQANWAPTINVPSTPTTTKVSANVRVFLGTTELTDIVRTEIDVYDNSVAQGMLAGQRP